MKIRQLNLVGPWMDRWEGRNNLGPNAAKFVNDLTIRSLLSSDYCENSYDIIM